MNHHAIYALGLLFPGHPDKQCVLVVSLGNTLTLLTLIVTSAHTTNGCMAFVKVSPFVCNVLHTRIKDRMGDNVSHVKLVKFPMLNFNCVLLACHLYRIHRVKIAIQALFLPLQEHQAVSKAQPGNSKMHLLGNHATTLLDMFLLREQCF